MTTGVSSLRMAEVSLKLANIALDGKKLASTKEDKILELEEAVRISKARFMTTSNQTYGGAGKSLEQFDTSNNNIVKNADLMPCPRRPAKK
jgi:hypothetical protein